MNNALRIFLALAAGSIGSALAGQGSPFGSPFINNYPHFQTGGAQQNWCITVDHRGVVYTGNHSEGILEFDGSSWRSISTGGRQVLSLACGAEGNIFVGLAGDLGWLKPDARGELCYESLGTGDLEEIYPGFEVWRTHVRPDKVYFSSRYAFFIYHRERGELEHMPLPELTLFSYLIQGEVYHAFWDSGLVRPVDSSFVPAPGGSLLKECSVFDLQPFEGSQVLAATMYEGLILFDLESGEHRTSFPDAQVQDLLKRALITDLLLTDDRIYVGTVEEGVLVLDRQGRLQERISTAEGLLNNTISQMHLQRSGSHRLLWVAHWAGVSMIELSNPIRQITFSSTDLGFSGFAPSEYISDLCYFGDMLMVASSEGLYRWQQDAPGASFEKLDDIQESVFDLQLIEPRPGLQLLLASTDRGIFVVDSRMNIRLVDLPNLGGRQILYDPSRPQRFYAGSYELHEIATNGRQFRELRRSAELEHRLQELVIDKQGKIWMSTIYALYAMERDDFGSLTAFDTTHGLTDDEWHHPFLHPETGKIWIGSRGGFFHFQDEEQVFIPDSSMNALLSPGENYVYTTFRDAEGDQWVSYQNEAGEWKDRLIGLWTDLARGPQERVFRRFPNASTEAYANNPEGGLWLIKANTLYHVQKSFPPEGIDTAFHTLIRKVEINGDSSLYLGSFADGLLHPAGQTTLPSKTPTITFEWSAPFYLEQDQMRYSYQLAGFDEEWSKWHPATTAKYTNLKHGSYELQVKAQNVYGDQSQPAVYRFVIQRPWYLSMVSMALYLALGGLLIWAVMRYTRGLKKRALVLERKNSAIALQKQELERMNDEITAHRDEIEAQRDSMTRQRDLIEGQKRAMTDGILYARRIQDAMLPAKDVVSFLLPKHFVFYRPQQIVSGDFFWIDKKEDTVLLALGDCTGHGVPGAFMSMLGVSLLNEISHKYTHHPTNELMDELRDHVMTSLRQTGGEGETRDGMDMGLLAINMLTLEVEFTGAHHNLYIFRKGVLEEIKGDRMPVGIHARASSLFTAHRFQLKRGDSLYLFSDGFPDQFGGEKGKKYGYRRLRELLGSLQNLIMNDQLNAIGDEFDRWKGDEDQVDDVLLIGIKL